MSKYLPTKEDVTDDIANHDNVMHSTPFEEKCKGFFGYHRMCMNRIQVQQAADYFCKKWNIQIHKQSGCVTCSYAKPFNQSNLKKIGQSENSQYRQLINCPFVIRYCRVNYKYKTKNSPLTYRVWITSMVAKHTCLMTNSAFRVTQKTSHRSKNDLNNLKTIVSCLKVNPFMKAMDLRTLLKDSVPKTTCIDHVYLNNFRRRVAIYHAKNPYSTITHDIAKCLTKGTQLHKKELATLEDPLVYQNFQKMYREIMSQDAGTWQVISFLEQCKNEMPGFDFRVLKDKEGYPIAIMWMTALMRYNLRRYAHILFLDCQKRQMNKIHWPYIGPAIINNEMRVSVTAEAIVTSEDIDTYTWIIKCMSEIEQSWKPNRIDIIYSDGFMTDRLLSNLGILDSCTLHGDYFHLHKEIWPKSENFGIHYDKVYKQLRAMFMSSKEEEWDIAYIEAKNILKSYPDKVTILDRIHDNPKYYSGFHTRKIQCNLGLNGSSIAEINHSSVVAHLGSGGVQPMIEQLSKLLTRQQHLYNKEREEEMKALTYMYKYKTKYVGEKALYDIEAKKNFQPMLIKNCTKYQ